MVRRVWACLVVGLEVEEDWGGKGTRAARVSLSGWAVAACLLSGEDMDAEAGRVTVTWCLGIASKGGGGGQGDCGRKFR